MDRTFTVWLYVAALLISAATGLVTLQTRAMVAELRTEIVEKLRQHEHDENERFVRRQEFEARFARQ